MKVSIVVKSGLVQAVYSDSLDTPDVEIIDLDNNDGSVGARQLATRFDELDKSACNPNSAVTQAYP